MRLRRKPKTPGPGDVPRGWFELSHNSEADLSAPQHRLLLRARGRLEALSPARARPQESWAGLEPFFDKLGRPTGLGTLWLCVPIEGDRHASLQVGLGGGVIVGGWQDRHYAWDDPRGEAFREKVTLGAVDGPISNVLDWLEEEFRRNQLL